MDKVLEFRDIYVSFVTRRAEVRVLRGINLSLAEGEILGLVGKSGSGKTVLALCALGMRSYRQRTTGSVTFLGSDLLTMAPRQLRRLRGRQISLVLSNPHSLLDPLARVGHQIANVYSAHHKSNHAEAHKRAEDMLRAVGIPDPERRMDAYPHQLSGGMAQRVVIGMALISSPRLLIADEPTFGLDVTIQAQVLALIRNLSRDLGTTTLLITRDIGVVANFCDRVAVIDEGHIVEQADVHHFFPIPVHPFSREMLGLRPDPSEWGVVVERSSRDGEGDWVELEAGHFVRTDPDLGGRTVSDQFPETAGSGRQDTTPRGAIGSDVHYPSLAGDPPATPLLEMRGLVKNFLLPKGRLVVHAVNGVTLELGRRETVALVGESGSGKTTIGRLILGLERPSGGQLLFDGETINELSESDFRRRLRPRIQMVFQEPFESLNPRMKVRDAILEPLRQWRTWTKAEVVQRLKETADQVELQSTLLDAYPHELTSGQQQRAAIARAIAVNPDLLVLDEPTSYLDPMESDRLLRLFIQLQRDKGLSYLFISHDLAKVRWLSHRVAVMYLGRILEAGPTEDVFRSPQHPYTEALLSAALRPDPRHRESVILLKGEIPSPVNLPRGCFFHTRCPYEIAGCASSEQVLISTAVDRMVACWRVTERAESLVDMRALASSPNVLSRAPK